MEKNKTSKNLSNSKLPTPLRSKLPTTLSDMAYYASYYRENRFVDKLLKVARLLGRWATKQLLILYYLWRDGALPQRDKLLLMGCLGYFVLPFDLIPDFIAPVIGFTDDMAVVSIGLRILKRHITPAIIKKASQRANQIFEE